MRQIRRGAPVAEAVTASATDEETITVASASTADEETITEAATDFTTASETTASGQCGDDAYWSFNETTGTLMISGTGDLYDISWTTEVTDKGTNSYPDQPWWDYNDEITTLVIGDSITSVGALEFAYLSLTSVTIGTGVVSIGDSAFEGCEMLSDVVIPGNVQTIGDYAFDGCNKLSITIENGVISIGKYAFRYTYGTTDLIIPDSVTTIGDYAFYWMDLESVTIGSGVTSIGKKAFGKYYSLNKVVFTGDAPTIGEDAFWGYYEGNSEYDTEITAYYPANNSTWTEDVMQQYGGVITWVSYEKTDIDISACTISLSATSYTYDGKAKTPTVTVTYNGVTLVSGTDYTAAYSSNINAGTATVTITGCGDYTGTVAKNYTINKATQKITLSKTSVSVAVGSTSTVTATASGGGSISWKSSSTSKATVSSGTIKGVAVGTATITVTAAATDNYKAATATVSVSVVPAAVKISSAANVTSGITVKWGKVTGASGYYIYRKAGSGSYSLVKTITSGSTVSYTDTAVKSKSGTTYTYYVIAYYKNSSGTITKGTYSNTKSIRRLSSATISSLTNTSSGITVKWGKITGASGYYVYRKAGSGSYSLAKTITSTSTVSWSDTAVKSKNGTTYTYYVIPYYKNSSGTITKGSYANTKKTVRLTAVSISSLKNSSSKKMTVKWAKNSKATGYQIQYSTSSSFASGNKTVTISSASTVSKVISSLTKGKTYYVRIRAYKTVSGTKYYSAWSSKKSVKISK